MILMANLDQIDRLPDDPAVYKGDSMSVVQYLDQSTSKDTPDEA